MKECPIKYRQKYSSISTSQRNHTCIYLTRIKMIDLGDLFKAEYTKIENYMEVIGH